MDKKPSLAIMIGTALAKKGKAKHGPDMEDEKEDTSGGDKDEQMLQIAEEMLDAIEAKDASALKDLLMEAIECCGSSEY